MTLRALIVDDSLTVRMHLASALESAGFEAVLAATGTDARRALAMELFDLVILDVILPDDNGVEILRSIRETPASARTPVMLLSTEAEVRNRIRGLATGADEYIGKPYEVSYVTSRARALLRRAGGGNETTPTILLVDDSATFRNMLREKLEGAGYQVLLAETGEEGLRLAADSRPHALLIDSQLPGIDGATVIRRIRLDSTLRRTPCVLITASDDKDAEVAALDAGADAFVRKGEDIDIALARLSAVVRSAVNQPPVDPGQTSALGTKRILAVDDSPLYLDTLGAALRSDGYEVALAGSGEEALDLIAVQPVDCILIDMVMPGVGGKEICRRLKASPGIRDTPLIMLTSRDDRESMIEGLSAGADDYIVKSADLQVIRSRIAAQLRRKQFEDESRQIREELLRKEMEAQEARAARELAKTRSALLADLERKNKELEAFSYSVSHDLRGPLRTIDGFSAALLEDCGEQLDEVGKSHLRRVREAARRMGDLIDDLLKLSRIGRGALNVAPVDLSSLVREVFDDLARKQPERRVELVSPEALIAEADGRMMLVVFENLLGNAFKFTSKTDSPRIEFGCEPRGSETVYFVRDNGAGFDMRYASKLFGPFQRLHRATEFPGTGIGLATVQRIASRHGGRIWAEAEPGKGATFRFSL